MSALDRLQTLLRSASAEPLSRAWAVETSIDTHIRELDRYLRNGTSAFVPRDIREEAVRRFWTTKRLDNLKDGRLVSHSIALPIGSNRLRIIEDPERFETLLNYIDQFLRAPKKFRRCFQGLLSEYFSYDPDLPATPTAGRQNWKTLRTYLHERVQRIITADRNPEWADVLQQHRTLLTDDPCGRYGGPLLSGDSKEIEELRGILNISDSSWFMRKLYLAQIRAAVSLPDAQFLQHLDRALQLLQENDIIRDEGIALLLNRYAGLKTRSLVSSLRDAAVDAWGNPWLESRAMHWGRVSQEAREMISEWLKLEFIEAFFTLLAEEHTGDNRRLEFWASYVNAIEDIHFALGAEALHNRSPDFKSLRKKMEGLLVPLQDPVRSNNAFIMRMGTLIVVEFSGYSNACYGYDVSQALPFRLDQPVVLPIDAKNSLKRSSRNLWLSHQDGIHGFATWEERFKSVLRQGYNIMSSPSGSTPSPSSSKKSSPRATQPPPRQHTTASNPTTVAPTQSPLARGRTEELAKWKSTKFSRDVLSRFCMQFHLKIEDLTPPPHGGNLWVRTDDSDSGINQVLAQWGFAYKNAKKGWWWKWS